MIFILNFNNFFDLSKTKATTLLNSFEKPYEAIPHIADFIKKLSLKLNDDYTEIAPFVFIHKSVRVAKSASITGPCIIDQGSEIRHCAYIRGSALVGKNCVIGNSTEIKNAILFDNAQAPHYNYIGDSILGYGAHFGAGSITSNLKSDKSNVTIKFNGQAYNTGLKKFGALVGDGVEIGCGCVLNPGCIIFKNTNVYPLSSVRGVVPKNSIYKSCSEIVLKTESR